MVAKLDVNLISRQGSMQKIGSFEVKDRMFWGERSDLFVKMLRTYLFYLPFRNDYLL